MLAALRIAALAAAAALAGCHVDDAGPGHVPRATGAYVPGHFGQNGFWVPGHDR